MALMDLDCNVGYTCESPTVQGGDGQHGCVSGSYAAKTSCNAPQDYIHCSHEHYSKAIKLPCLRLNRAKVEEFTYLQGLNIPVANNILAMPKGERRMLTLPQRA